MLRWSCSDDIIGRQRNDGRATGTASACTAGSVSSDELETNLFSGEDVLPDDIDFQFCVYGSGATFTAVADDNDGCVISLNRNGSPSRSGCN